MLRYSSSSTFVGINGLVISCCTLTRNYHDKRRVPFLFRTVLLFLRRTEKVGLYP